MARHVALLRGINVGGKNKLPMADLNALCAAVGCTEVSTYIQSGNVVFSASARLASGIADKIAQAIAKKLGLNVPVVIRSAAEMVAVTRNNPYLTPGANPDKLYVVFLADPPSAASVASLDAKRSPPDTFVVRGQEIYLCLPNGAGRSKLTNAYFDAKLRTVSTARNWRTVLQLAKLAVLN